VEQRAVEPAHHGDLDGGAEDGDDERDAYCAEYKSVALGVQAVEDHGYVRGSFREDVKEAFRVVSECSRIRQCKSRQGKRTPDQAEHHFDCGIWCSFRGREGQGQLRD
jgi:hypothetical protein